MRTSVELDPDVELMLREEAQRRGVPFEQVLNDAIRAGLPRPRQREEPFDPPTFDMGEAGVDLTKALALAAELEDDELVDRYRRGS